MKEQAPFMFEDLEELHQELLSQAERVVPMRDVFKGDVGARVIGLRHDVDDNQGSFETALRMAEWEFEHGYSSTYFLLHGSHYWDAETLEHASQFEELGHEVGIHVNAIAESFRQKRDAHAILAEEIAFLRATGVRVVGCVAHGDNLCHRVGFVNDEMFVESPRPAYGAPDRELHCGSISYQIAAVSRVNYGLEYDANWLPRTDYLSDSGGYWSQSFDGVAARFGVGQLHVLVHPDWWTEAFIPEVVML